MTALGQFRRFDRAPITLAIAAGTVKASCQTELTGSQFGT
jgi:hypothetical protein